MSWMFCSHSSRGGAGVFNKRPRCALLKKEYLKRISYPLGMQSCALLKSHFPRGNRQSVRAAAASSRAGVIW
jgi:hypothetical protein